MTVAVPTKKAFGMLRCGSRILVLAFSPQGVQVLTEMTDPVEVDFLTGLCRQSGDDSQSTGVFLDLFRRPTAAEDDGNGSPSEPRPSGSVRGSA